MAIQRQTKRVQPAVQSVTLPQPPPRPVYVETVVSAPPAVSEDTPQPEPQTALSQPIQGQPTVNKQITFSIPTGSIAKWGQTLLIFVLGLIIIYNFVGKQLIDNWRSDDSVQVEPDEERADDKIVSPVEVVTDDHAAAAAIALYRLHAADWQSKMEIMKLAGKQKFEKDEERAEWINKEFAERFSSSADAFMEELSQVMTEKLEGRMGDIMSNSRVSYDVDGATAKIDAAAKKLKKKK